MNVDAFAEKVLFEPKFEEVHIVGNYEEGYADGYKEGKASADQAAYAKGWSEGEAEGREAGYQNGRADGYDEGYYAAIAKLTDIVITENGIYEPEGDSIGFRQVHVKVFANSGRLTLGEDGVARYDGDCKEVWYTLHMVDGASSVPIASDYISGNEQDFSEKINESGAGEYFVTCVVYNSEGIVIGEYTSNTVEFGGGIGGDDGNWLFKEQYLDMSGNGTLPAPVVGTSYTVFVDGEEKVTVVYEYEGQWLQWANGAISHSSWNGGWSFLFDPPSDCLTESGVVSIRINRATDCARKVYCYDDNLYQWDIYYGAAQEMSYSGQCPKCNCELGDFAGVILDSTNCPCCNAEISYNRGEITLAN